MKSAARFAAILLLVSASAFATTFHPLSDQEMVDRAEAVIEGTVLDVSTARGGGGEISTTTRVSVSRVLKGSIRVNEVVSIRESGGRIGNLIMHVIGGARYEQGEAVFVFLDRAADGEWRTFAMSLGKFRRERDRHGRTLLIRETEGHADERPRDGELYPKFVSDVVAGRSAEVPRFASVTALQDRRVATTATASSYLQKPGATGFGTRWPGNNSPSASVTFSMTGSNGISAATAASAANAWATSPGSNISLNTNGSSPGTNPNTMTGGGKNTIYNGHAQPTIGSCETQGVVACTVLWVNDATTHSFSSETFLTILEANLVFPSPTGENVAIHEMGHAIGLRHSNQASPSSTDAIMNSVVSRSTLGEWDKDAVATVYGSGPPCTQPTNVSITGANQVNQGSTTTLTANVTGGRETFTYQWYEGNAPSTTTPVGTNSKSFNTPPITSTKSYWVKVTNGCDSFSLNSPTFTITPLACVPPTVNVHPQSRAVDPGTFVTLSAGGTGTEPITITWYAGPTGDKSQIVGSGAFFSFTATQQASYWALLKNGCGEAATQAAVITINGQCVFPAFTTQPAGGTVSAGAMAYLTAAASNVTSYSWFRGSAPDTSNPITTVTGANAVFVNKLYADVLNRPIDGAGTAFIGHLDGGSMTHAAVANAVLTSTEYRNALVQGFYQTLLGRNPSAAEIAFWTPAFAAGQTNQQVQSQIIGSAEYFALSGSTIEGFLAKLYLDVLGRAITDSELGFLSGASMSRSDFGLQTLNSSEAIDRRIQGWYSKYLRRSADASALAAFRSQLQGGATDEAVQSQILGSQEYRSTQNVIFVGPINATTSFWVRATNSCGSTNSSNATFTVGCDNPVIARQPQNVAVNIGDTPKISVGATGATSYQWYLGTPGNTTQPIAGATAATLTNTPFFTGGSVWVRVTNACGSTDSAAATVTINCVGQVPVIDVPPAVRSTQEFTISWTGDSRASSAYELQEATKADFSDATLFVINGGATSRAFPAKSGLTAETRFFYRVRSIPVCGSTPGEYSRPASMLVNVPPPPTSSIFNFSQLPCTSGPSCTITQTIFVSGLTTPATFTITADVPWITFNPAGGTLPVEGVNVVATVNTVGLALGSAQATVSVTKTPLASDGARTNATTVTPFPLTVSVVSPVSPLAKDGTANNALIIPAVAHLQGLGSEFVSDVRITNTTAQAIQYLLSYTPGGIDGTTSGKQMKVNVAAGQTLALNDVVKSWFGAGAANESGIGSIEIKPLNYSGGGTIGASRTYALTPTGTLGQFIPALPVSEFLKGGSDAFISLQQIAQNAAFRTNLGLVEGSGFPANVELKLLDGAGNVKATTTQILRPFELAQFSVQQAFPGQTLSDGRVEARVLSDSGKVSVYASVLDNKSNDPLLVLPVEPGKVEEERYVLAGVGDLDTGVVKWKSDVRVYNAGEDEVPVTLTYYPQGGGTPHSFDTVLGAGEVKSFNNFTIENFNLKQTAGSVLVTAPEGSSLVATARTYADAPEGTYGQFIPGVSPSQGIGLGDRPIFVLQLEESPMFRTNAGLVELTGNDVMVRIKASTPDSRVTGVVEVFLPANQFLQYNGIFKQMGYSESVYNGTLSYEVIGGEGRVAGYGSNIDLRTQDPTYIFSQQ